MLSIDGIAGTQGPTKEIEQGKRTFRAMQHTFNVLVVIHIFDLCTWIVQNNQPIKYLQIDAYGRNNVSISDLAQNWQIRIGTKASRPH